MARGLSLPPLTYVVCGVWRVFPVPSSQISDCVLTAMFNGELGLTVTAGGESLILGVTHHAQTRLTCAGTLNVRWKS